MKRQKNAAITADLDTAKKIQIDALTVDYPAFPKHPEVNLVASMDTAKEMGGDFYDFFEIRTMTDFRGYFSRDITFL